MKLVLFDIDGTLIYHVGKRPWKDQYSYAAEKVFGVTVDFDSTVLNGRIEKEVGWIMVSKCGVARQEFDQKFDAYVQAMYEYLQKESMNDPLYEIITSAENFVKILHRKRPELQLGIISGNARKTGEWKLDHTGLTDYFRFGLYGDQSEDRIQLAGTVFSKYSESYGSPIHGEDIVVIGDTIYDIRCGKAIRAKTIAVTTGLHGDPAVLQEEAPDFLVSSLMDQSVLQFFGV